MLHEHIILYLNTEQGWGRDARSSSPPLQVRMLYVGGAHNGHGPEFRERARARLEAGWVRRMRHARARLAVIVGTRLVDIVRV